MPHIVIIWSSFIIFTEDREQRLHLQSKLISILVLFGLGHYFNYSYSAEVTKKDITESFILLVKYLYMKYFKNLKIQYFKFFFKVPDHEAIPNSFASVADIYSKNELDIWEIPVPIFCGDFLNITCAQLCI